MVPCARAYTTVNLHSFEILRNYLFIHHLFTTISHAHIGQCPSDTYNSYCAFHSFVSSVARVLIHTKQYDEVIKLSNVAESFEYWKTMQITCVSQPSSRYKNTKIRRLCNNFSTNEIAFSKRINIGVGAKTAWVGERERQRKIAGQF